MNWIRVSQNRDQWREMSRLTEGRILLTAQAVLCPIGASRWPVTAEARVLTRINPCGICGGQSGSGTGFSPSSSIFPCQYHSTGFDTRISSVGRKIGPLLAAVQRHRLTPSKIK
jgi:hypothetical protein